MYAIRSYYEEAPPKEPLADNGDGTITDPNTGLMWKKADAWNDMHVFYTWGKHAEYVNKVNKDKFAGYSDWRIPDKKEAATLIEKDKEVMDKYGIPRITSYNVCYTKLLRISEIVSRFDIIAIQEVKGNLRALRHMLKYLNRIDDVWSFILTDKTRGDAGNNERLAFVFDTRRVLV